ncbi:hypothetical protein AC579_469 [Pseudocercospora musae]|uniref:Uncharacterized protein n=1 Tax=Pseudocercospora musae TaxID=113226 RepID=A0A139IND8_9PEZI|nr:hypothetical protein AC579_469 [Pseudocercospora musae]
MVKSYSRLLTTFLLFLSTYARTLDSGKDDPPSPQDEYDSRYWITVMPYLGTGCDPSTPLPNSAIIHRSFNTHDNYVTDGGCRPVQAGDLVGSVQIIGGEKCRVSLQL